MNTDMSVAPEIALLATPLPRQQGNAITRPTIGAMAAELRALARPSGALVGSGGVQ